MPEPPPPPPVLPAVDPLGQLGAITTFAGDELRGAALTGIHLPSVDASGTARGTAEVSVRRPVATVGASACAGRVTLATDGLTWSDPGGADACAAPLLALPTCTLAEVVTRMPARGETWANGATVSLTYRVRTGAAPAEAPAGRPAPSTKRLPGEWLVETLDRTVTVNDDCKPPPKPRPVATPPRDRPRRPR